MDHCGDGNIAGPVAGYHNIIDRNSANVPCHTGDNDLLFSVTESIAAKAEISLLLSLMRFTPDHDGWQWIAIELNCYDRLHKARARQVIYNSVQHFKKYHAT